MFLYIFLGGAFKGFAVRLWKASCGGNEDFFSGQPRNKNNKSENILFGAALISSLKSSTSLEVKRSNSGVVSPTRKRRPLILQ